MKIGFTVLHGNITDKNKNSIGNNEAIGIANKLRKYCQVDILTCKSCEGCITVDENYDINQYDALLVVNGSVNMFGGKEIETATTIYKLLHKFDNKIYYLLTDTLMPFVDYYKHIEKKPWNNYTEEDFKLKHNINIISQFKDEEKIKKIFKGVEIDDFVYIPLQYWSFDYQSNFIPTNIEKTVDLIYGGSYRAGNRREKMLRYFFNKENISVEMYGNINVDQFKITDKDNITKLPTFTKKVLPNEVLAKNSTGLATVLLGDKNYNDNTMTPRFIEALMSKVICFIDEEFDPSHSLLVDDYFYINSGEELENKILEIKNNKELYYKLLNAQDIALKSILQYDLGKDLFTYLNS